MFKGNALKLALAAYYLYVQFNSYSQQQGNYMYIIKSGNMYYAMCDAMNIDGDVLLATVKSMYRHIIRNTTANPIDMNIEFDRLIGDKGALFIKFVSAYPECHRY